MPPDAATSAQGISLAEIDSVSRRAMMRVHRILDQVVKLNGD